jgi:hypothetical protein
MFGFGLSTCFFCERRVPKKTVFRGQDDVAICLGCYEKWAQEGRQCSQCKTVVHGPQDLAAFFKPRPSFGHADCGGVRLTR